MVWLKVRQGFCVKSVKEAKIYPRLPKSAILKVTAQSGLTTCLLYTSYQSALSSAFGANQGPDVFWNWGTKNGILESIVAEDYVMPLTDIADMSLFEKDGEKTMISGICYVNDILYGVPTAAVDTRTI